MELLHGRPTRITLWASMLFLMAAGLGACNTMEGFGQDVESAGEALEEEAE